jgi:hypothetical protein
MATDPALRDPRFLAAIDMIGRTGALGIQIRYSDDEPPVVWLVIAEYRYADGRPVPAGGQVRHEVSAALHPLQAALRLCNQLVDGGHCVHCNRPTGFAETIGSMPLAEAVCWYQWDPELRVFRRGCEEASR